MHGATRRARGRRLADLLVPVPRHHVEPATPVAPGVAADEPGSGQFLQILGDVRGGVFGTQCPQAPRDHRGHVAEPSSVVRLRQQAVKGALGGDAHRSQILRFEGLRLDGPYPGHSDITSATRPGLGGMYPASVRIGRRAGCHAGHGGRRLARGGRHATLSSVVRPRRYALGRVGAVFVDGASALAGAGVPHGVRRLGVAAPRRRRVLYGYRRSLRSFGSAERSARRATPNIRRCPSEDPDLAQRLRTSPHGGSVIASAVRSATSPTDSDGTHLVDWP